MQFNSKGDDGWKRDNNIPTQSYPSQQTAKGWVQIR